MSTTAVNIVKVLFVAGLYVFLWYVARAVRAQLAVPAAGTEEAPPAPTGETRRVEPPRLVITGESEQVIEVREEVVVGRGVEAGVILSDSFASDTHARFGSAEGRLWIEDLESTNGTLVNDSPVTGRISLDRGDVIVIGQTTMEVR